MKILLLVLLLSVSIKSQISPGDLSTAHASLEGISNCTKCHEIGARVSSQKCLNCHKEIQSLISSGHGYHSISSVKSKECSSCHNEHHGRNFRIINFNQKDFNHSQTGFTLTGAHVKIECRTCHQPRYITSPELALKKNTYMGLSTNCSSCHEDYHQGTLSVNCSGCHNTVKFKPAPGFNHAASEFRLTGAHLSTACILCHPIEKRNGKEFQKFKDIAFRECSNCHKDIHAGKFGTDCRQCHTTSSFRQVSTSAFDHNKTGFPLKGSHKLTGCKDCHKNSVTTKLIYDRCSGCHTDYHRGEFTTNGILRDCSECHNENKFSPSLFSIENHRLSRFILEGAHLAVPCRDCHFEENSWRFRNIGLQCIDCHNNVHGSEISQKFNPLTCTNCHKTETWSAINFDHNLTNFKLAGKHSSAACSQCHFRERKEYKFLSLNPDCTGCHNDVHFRQFPVSECSRCHTFFNWSPDNFDHNKTRFPLTGAHLKVSCSGCHKQVTRNNNTFILYKIESFKCADCHS